MGDGVWRKMVRAEDHSSIGITGLREDSFFSDLCWGKAIAAYTKPQQRRKEESGKANRRRR